MKKIIFIISMIFLLFLPKNVYADDDIRMTILKGDPDERTDAPYTISVVIECDNGIQSISNSMGTTYSIKPGEIGHKISTTIDSNGTYTFYVTDANGKQASFDVVITNLTTTTNDTTPPSINVIKGNPSTKTEPPYELTFSCTDNVGLSFVYVNDQLLTGTYVGYTASNFTFKIYDNGSYVIKAVDSAGLSSQTTVLITNIGVKTANEVVTTPVAPTVTQPVQPTAPETTSTVVPTQPATQKTEAATKATEAETVTKEPQTKLQATVKAYEEGKSKHIG
ncbi:MAG: hypothetical protein ACI4QE_04505, partial [Acutalibacteraceae bacterium]